MEVQLTIVEWRTIDQQISTTDRLLLPTWGEDERSVYCDQLMIGLVRSSSSSSWWRECSHSVMGSDQPSDVNASLSWYFTDQEERWNIHRQRRRRRRTDRNEALPTILPFLWRVVELILSLQRRSARARTWEKSEEGGVDRQLGRASEHRRGVRRVPLRRSSTDNCQKGIVCFTEKISMGSRMLITALDRIRKKQTVDYLVLFNKKSLREEWMSLSRVQSILEQEISLRLEEGQNTLLRMIERDTFSLFWSHSSRAVRNIKRQWTMFIGISIRMGIECFFSSGPLQGETSFLSLSRLIDLDALKRGATDERWDEDRIKTSEVIQSSNVICHRGKKLIVSFLVNSLSLTLL